MILWCRAESCSFLAFRGSLAGWWCVRPAASVKVGTPRPTAWPRRAVIWSIWAGLALGAGEADLQSFGLAEPALGFGLGDAGDEVVADLDQVGSGGGIGA